ncbi:hypothetical protein PLICRDRAFT_109912, partial [Plicaturopsis crispa FD-325 SS-3]
MPFWQAGLFSAILTAFIIEFYKNLQPDPQQTTADLLANITQILHSAIQNQTQILPDSGLKDPAQYALPCAVVWVNTLWFSSLACSLGAAVAAMVAKQWLLFYNFGLSSGTAYDYAHRRQYRYNTLINWHVPGIISALPLLMHLSVVLFFTGLVVQLWQINKVVASMTLTLITIFLGCYFVTLILPWVYASCPYKSSALVLLQHSMHYIHLNIWKVIHLSC